MSERRVGLSWAQVLAWRMSLQLLELRGTATAPVVARALCGIQVQVGSGAELAVAIRQRTPRPGEVEEALWKERSLVKTWAMRGTLHLLPADVAGSYVATLGRLRPWEAKAWERYHGISTAEVDRVCEAIGAVLGSAPRAREELSTEIAEHVHSKKIAQKLGSGWSELLKPAAFQGLLCQGPPRDRNVTFVSPRHWIAGWRLPDPDDAGTDLDARSLPEPTSRRNADVEPTPLVRVVEIDVDVEATQPLGRGAGCVIDEPLHGDARFRALPERRERLLG